MSRHKEEEVIGRRFISLPTGPPARSESLTTRDVLLRLVFRRPNEIITTADVCAELGYEVGRGAIGNAVNRMRKNLPIEGVPGSGGGYVLLFPMLTLGGERCANCAHRTPDGICERIGDVRPNLNARCWGWTAMEKPRAVRHG